MRYSLRLPRWHNSWLALLLLALVLTGMFCAIAPRFANAADDTQGNFSLQITPSPLVSTLKPGTSTQLELKVRNAGTSLEQLRIDPRSFTLNSKNGQVNLDDTTPTDVGSWITFSNPSFDVQPGEWFTQKVTFNLPKDTGFSYAFALVISRRTNPAPVAGGRLIKGSIADFALINVDRPGATRKLEIPKLTMSKGVYEYLPATVQVKFNNVGNSIVQPTGNIFIQRGSTDATPISTLPVNETKGYILPGSNRELDTTWTDGFPVYKTTTASDGTKKSSLKWDWSKVANLRVGRYTAKLVAVYDDGQRDVPIQQEVNFWVIPWKILIGLFVVFLILLYGAWSIIRKIIKIINRIRGHGKPKTDEKKGEKTENVS